MNFNSNVDEMRYYAKELLKDGKEHKASEINEYIQKNSLKAIEFTRGMLACALKTLVQNEGYKIIRRGVYKQVSELNNDEPQNKKKDSDYLLIINKILEKAINETKSASSGDMLEISDEEINLIRRIGKMVIEDLNELKNKINV